MKESFIFYRSFYEALKELSKEDRVEIIDAICELALNETEVELKGGIQKAMFALMKPQIEANNKRYANGCRAKTKQKASEKQADDEQSECDIEAKRELNRSKQQAKQKQSRSETEAKTKQDASEPEANENVNDNVNVNDNENDKKGKEKASSSSDDSCVQDEKATKVPYAAIIDYLNQKTGKRFSSKAKDAQRRIKARWNEGYRYKDFVRVIDVKTSEWLNNQDMEKYLCPETLFGPKFEKYVNQKDVKRLNTGLPEWYDQKPDTPVDPDVLKRALKAQQRASEERTG